MATVNSATITFEILLSLEGTDNTRCTQSVPSHPRTTTMPLL